MNFFHVILAFVIFIGFLFEISENVQAYPIINEIMYDPPGGRGTDAELEWIELYSNDEVNLSRYYLDGENLNGSFNGYFIIARNKEEFLNYYKERIDCGVVDVNIVLSNQGRKINLSSLTYEDVIEYSPSMGGKENGKTLERVNPGKSEFKESLIIGGSPCRENSVFVANVAPASPEFITSSAPSANIPENNIANNPQSQATTNNPVIAKQDHSGIKIIGIMPNPEGEDNGLMPNGEWIELYNSGNLEVNLSGLLFYDAAGNLLKIMENNTAVIVLQPATSTKVYRNGNNKFSLNNDGDEITLESSYDEVVDKAVYSGSKEGLILRKVNDEWVSEEKPRSEQKEVSKSSSSSGKKSKASKIEVISAPKDESKKISKAVKQERIATTTTIIVRAVEPGLVYQSKDKKAAESGIMFFGFTIFLLIVVLLFKKDF